MNQPENKRIKSRLRTPQAKLRFALKSVACRMGCATNPDFMIIGAAKSGTTAMQRMLANHPQVVRSDRKEILFFSVDSNYRKGKTFYEANFPLRHRMRPGQLTFDATATYIYYPDCADRIYDWYPDIKLIALLREPVSRAYSHWNMFRQAFAKSKFDLRCYFEGDAYAGASTMKNQNQIRPFDEITLEEIKLDKSPSEVPEPSLVRRGIYHEQLRRYFNRFDRSQILVLESRQLSENTPKTLKRVFDFLGIDNVQIPDMKKRHHERAYSEPINEEIRATLSDFYRPHNAKLFELIDEEFDWND